MYRHPSPASTNPYWQTEIDSGPHLEVRGRKYANANRTYDGIRERELRRGVAQSSNASGLPSSVDLSMSGGSRDGRVDSKLHFQQFQRDDEQGPLSASTMDRSSLRSASDGMSSRSNIARPPKALMADDPHYVHHRNPQINDMHPATITKISSKEEAKWLLAPPPTADFMAGRNLASRTRSDSNGSSRLSSRTTTSLSREMSQKMMERKLKNGDVPLIPTLSRDTSGQAPSSPKGQTHDRDNVEEKDFALDDSPRSRPRRLSHLGQPRLPDWSEESTETLIRQPDLAPNSIPPQRQVSRPKLSPIVSSEGSESTLKENIHHTEDSQHEQDRADRRSQATVEDGSIKALQNLAPNSRIFKSQIVSSQDLAREPKSRRRRDSDQASEGAQEVIDSWTTMDFSSPDWIHEHTKREVKHRWSMDI